MLNQVVPKTLTRPEKTFIDFSGKRPSLVDRRTGELRPVELFVAVRGASRVTYAEASATQRLADWVNAHIDTVEYFGGSTALWVPDQLKRGRTDGAWWRLETGLVRATGVEPVLDGPETSINPVFIGTTKNRTDHKRSENGRQNQKRLAVLLAARRQPRSGPTGSWESSSSSLGSFTPSPPRRPSQLIPTATTTAWVSMNLGEAAFSYWHPAPDTLVPRPPPADSIAHAVQAHMTQAYRAGRGRAPGRNLECHEPRHPNTHRSH